MKYSSYKKNCVFVDLVYGMEESYERNKIWKKIKINTLIEKE